MNVTIMETRDMSKTKIKVELGKRVEKLEELGMSHEEACGFVSGIMNLGIAAQEKNYHQKSVIFDIIGVNIWKGCKLCQKRFWWSMTKRR